MATNQAAHDLLQAARTHAPGSLDQRYSQADIQPTTVRRSEPSLSTVISEFAEATQWINRLCEQVEGMRQQFVGEEPSDSKSNDIGPSQSGAINQLLAIAEYQKKRLHSLEMELDRIGRAVA